LKKKNSISKEKWPKFVKKYVDQKIKDQWNAYDNLIDDIKSNIFFGVVQKMLVLLINGYES